MAKSIHSRKQFLSTLEIDLPVALYGADEDTKDDGKSPSVVADMVLTRDPHLDANLFNDARNSTLLAQLAANKKVPDHDKDPIGWYKAYREVLENIGWRITDFSFNKSEQSSTNISVKEAIIGFLQTLLPGGAAPTIVSTIAALGKASNKGALELFKNNSSSNKAGKFQVGTTTPTADGSVSLSAGAFYFETSENKGTALFFFDWNLSNMSLYQSSQTMDLSMDIYNQVRQSVIDKLGPRAVSYVKNIDID